MSQNLSLFRKFREPCCKLNPVSYPSYLLHCKFPKLLDCLAGIKRSQQLYKRLSRELYSFSRRMTIEDSVAHTCIGKWHPELGSPLRKKVDLYNFQIGEYNKNLLRVDLSPGPYTTPGLKITLRMPWTFLISSSTRAFSLEILVTGSAGSVSFRACLLLLAKQQDISKYDWTPAARDKLTQLRLNLNTPSS